MLWVLLFESFDLCDEKLPVRKKGLLTFRSVERVVAAITFGANPAGVTADARSARIGKYSVTVVRGMEYHPLLLPDTHIGSMSGAAFLITPRRACISRMSWTSFSWPCK